MTNKKSTLLFSGNPNIISASPINPHVKGNPILPKTDKKKNTLNKGMKQIKPV